MGSKTTITLSDLVPGQCTEELAFKGMFGNVLCEVEKVNWRVYEFSMTFYSWPTYPKENNLFSHDGNPSRLDFFCDLTYVTSLTSCRFTDIEATNIQGKYAGFLFSLLIACVDFPFSLFFVAQSMPIAPTAVCAISVLGNAHVMKGMAAQPVPTRQISCSMVLTLSPAPRLMSTATITPPRRCRSALTRPARRIST